MEASSLGIDSFGADISEFNCLLAQVKIAEYDLDVLESDIRDILARSTEDVGADEQLRLLERQAAYFSNCYLQDWFAPKAQQELLAYRDLISGHGGQKPKYKYQNVLKVILSRAARSARQTPHFDLDFPKVPQKEPYHYYKHSRICRPTSTARQFLTSSPSEDYLAVLAGQRQWIATTNFAGCPGQPQIALRIAPCSLPRQSS